MKLTGYACVFLMMSASVFWGGCNEQTGIDYRGEKTFETWDVEIFADTDSLFAVDSLITITTRCHPMFDGKGQVGLSVMPGGPYPWEGIGAVLESPIQNTVLVGVDIHPKYIPVAFRANVPFEQQWKVRLGDPFIYRFYGHAVFDSVFVNGKMYAIESEELEKEYGLVDGGEAQSYPGLLLYPKQ